MVGANFGVTVDIQLLEVLRKYTSAAFYYQSFYEFRQYPEWNASSAQAENTSADGY